MKKSDYLYAKWTCPECGTSRVESYQVREFAEWDSVACHEANCDFSGVIQLLPFVECNIFSTEIVL